MIRTYNLGTINFEYGEIILMLFLVGFAYFIGTRLKVRNINKNEAYKYLLPALMFKIFGGFLFAFIYVFYYGGGDTISYYSSSLPLMNLFYEDPGDYFNIIWNSNVITENFSSDEWEAFTFNSFTNETGIPLSFISRDPKTFAVCKLTSPLLIITNGSYFACTILIAMLSFIPLWKLYLTFLKYFPVLHKELAYATLFIPSVVFWGSGMMKDTYTFAGVCLIIYAFQMILERKFLIFYILLFFVSAYSILAIKPYILNILVPCMGIWIFALVLKKVDNVIFKFIVLPFVFVGAVGASYFVLQSLGGSMDKFALDNAVQTAMVTQDDLKREEQYGSNNFDIGELDGSIGSFISKFPQATFAGFFRPMLIEARSPVMLLSALENLMLMILLVLTLIKVKFRLIIKIIRTTPILLFSFSFAILFAFMIGITTPNFGALVRFKIPLMPFFTFGLMVIYSTNKIINSRAE